MKNFKILITVCATLLVARKNTAQVLQPVIQWEVESALGEGAADVLTFMDYTDDILTASWAGAGATAGISSINSDGSTNAIGAVAWPSGSIVGPSVNLGATSYIHYINPITNTMTSALCNNEVITEALVSYTYNITFTYEQIEFIDAIMTTDMGIEHHTILLSVFDDTDGKEKALLITIDIDPVTETTSHFEIPIFIGSWATFPWEVVSSGNDIFVWGYFNKNAPGTNRDNFITKIHREGLLYSEVYTRAHASYAGRDDVASGLAMDNAGNLFGISQSEDNIEPYYEHIAVFKINPVNGKRLWVKRIGEGVLTHEYGHSVAADKIGNGLAITGSVSDGAGGRNARTWRLNGSGATLWVKTINNTGPGTLEEGREINFCLGSGDFNVMGYRGFDDNFFISRYNSTSGTVAWPLEIYNGEFAGQVIDGSMSFGSSLESDIYCTFLIQEGVANSMITTKFSQLVLKDASLPELDAALSVFPNPASDQIKIKGLTNNALIKIISVNGEIVFEGQVTTSNPLIDISTLAYGYYTIQTDSGSHVEYLHFIKVK